jgi:hypothetical protein
VIVGGVMSLLGIVNPPREAEHAEYEELGAVRLAHPCPEGRAPARPAPATPPQRSAAGARAP